jgi:hypothetical protein
MSDRGSTPSDPPSLADQGVGTTQVIDLADIDLSGVLPEERRVAPPPLPPAELARASHLPSAPPPSFQPPQAPLSQAPAPASSRSTSFYLIVLAACLVAFVGAGALIARSMRGAPPAAASAAPVRPSSPSPSASGAPAARVITISPVEMSDDVDKPKKK